MADGGVSSSSNFVFNPEHHSPSRGRTMKEYDQQIAELKNENFNLKLRVYFLEEKIQHRFSDSRGDYKTDITMKVEIGVLKQELKEKRELLLKASGALEVMELNCKAEKDELERKLNNRIQELENQISKGSSPEGSRHEESRLPSQSPRAHEENLLEGYKVKVEELQTACDKFTQELTESQNRVKELQKTLAQKEARIHEEDLLGLKRNKVIEGLMNAVQVKEKQITELNLELANKGSELKDAKEQLNEVLKKGPENYTMSRSVPSAIVAGSGDGKDQNREALLHVRGIKKDSLHGEDRITRRKIVNKLDSSLFPLS